MSVFALVDCNNFYVSCQRVFEPKYENRPVVVLSNNDGCVVARSNEAKNFGIPMGAPYFKCKSELQKIGCKVFSSNYSLYGDMSARVMKIINQACENIEIYSIDEAFLDLSNLPNKDLIPFCQNLKNYIKKCTGIPVSFGLGQTKTLAKLANNLAKSDMRTGPKLYNGVFSFIDIDELHKQEIFTQINVSELWGVGRKYSKKLAHNEIHTVSQLLNQNSDWIKENLTIQGAKLVQELCGNICHNLELFSPDKKSITSSRSFGKTITKLDSLKQAATLHATLIGEKLRKSKQYTSFLHLFVMSDRFKSNYQYKSVNIKLSSPTNFTPELIKKTVLEIEKLFDKETCYKKIGIIALDLQKEGDIQQTLFENKLISSKKEVDTMQAIDKINQKFGKLTVRSARLGYKNPWEMKQELASPNYTTSWKELLKI
jgi:DNA polymerase V